MEPGKGEEEEKAGAEVGAEVGVEMEETGDHVDPPGDVVCRGTNKKTMKAENTSGAPPRQEMSFGEGRAKGQWKGKPSR